MHQETPPSKVASNELLGPAAEARWYAVTKSGLATLCASERDALESAASFDVAYPHSAPHRAVLLGDVERMRAALADYFKAADASWRETCERAAKQGIASMEIGPANAAALEQFRALRAMFGA